MTPSPKPERTPTPWATYPHGAKTCIYTKDAEGKDHIIATELDHLDAEFIVRAVNAYNRNRALIADLITAIEIMRSQLRSLPASATAVAVDDTAKAALAAAAEREKERG